MLLEHCADLGRTFRQAVASHHLEHRFRGRCRERLSAEGARVISDKDLTGNVIVNPGRSDRHPVAERFGHGDDVGSDAVMLGAEPRSGSADAGLYLVNHEQRLGVRTASGDFLDEVDVEGQNASFGTDQFEQHCGGFVTNTVEKLVGTVEGQRMHTLEHRHEPLFFLWLTGRGQSAHRPPVEPSVSGQDVETVRAAMRAPPGACELDRCLIGLGTGVGEEHFAPAEQRDESFGDADLRFGSKQVGRVQQRVGLTGDGPGNVGVCVAEGRNGEAGQEVDVFGAVDVVQIGPRSALEGEGSGPVGVEYGRCVAGDPVLTRRRCAVQPHRRVAAHWPVPSQIMVPIPRLVKSSTRST